MNTKSHGAKKNYEAKKQRCMFIQELIFIYCDKIINSNGTNVFLLFFLPSTTLSAFFPVSAFLAFYFILAQVETKERQTDCNDVFIWHGALYIAA